jgi:hypothetical protein
MDSGDPICTGAPCAAGYLCNGLRSVCVCVCVCVRARVCVVCVRVCVRVCARAHAECGTAAAAHVRACAQSPRVKVPSRDIRDCIHLRREVGSHGDDHVARKRPRRTQADVCVVHWNVHALFNVARCKPISLQLAFPREGTPEQERHKVVCAYIRDIVGLLHHRPVAPHAVLWQVSTQI